MDYKSFKHLKLALIFSYIFCWKYDYNYNIIDYFLFLLSACNNWRLLMPLDLGLTLQILLKLIYFFKIILYLHSQFCILFVFKVFP